MKSRSSIALFAFVGLACGMLLVRAQEPDEVRGAFLSSRPKTTNTGAPTHRHRPTRNANANASTTATNANKTALNANTKSSVNKNTSSVNVPLQAIGLGYT